MPNRTGQLMGTTNVIRAGTGTGLVTRRAFIVRAARTGLAMAVTGPMLAACESGARPSRSSATIATPTASPASSADLPVVEPTPTSSHYGDLLALAALDLSDVGSPSLRALAEEIAADAGINIAGGSRSGTVVPARLTVAADDPSLPDQSYRLAVEAGTAGSGPTVEIRAGAEAGAWNGLLSLAQLLVSDRSGAWIRAVELADGPGFRRRGVILDPYLLPDIGVTEASKALLMARLRFGVRFKANFLDLVDRVPWPEVVTYCRDHHVELMNSLGYKNWIVE
jgi:hypothetical protein